LKKSRHAGSQASEWLTHSRSARAKCRVFHARAARVSWRLAGLRSEIGDKSNKKE
jgi:hypothetical protein